MAKTNFSSAVETSLIGRDQEERRIEKENVKAPALETPKKEETPREKKKAENKPTLLGLDDLFPDKKVEKMGSHTFYISDDVYEKLDAFSKKKGVSSSKVVNDILKTCL